MKLYTEVHHEQAKIIFVVYTLGREGKGGGGRGYTRVLEYK